MTKKPRKKLMTFAESQEILGHGARNQAGSMKPSTHSKGLKATRKATRRRT